MSIVYAISSHGLGHAVRSVAIINRIPASIPVIIWSKVPAQFLQEELQRPATILNAGFDCGAVQLDGLTLDQEKTKVAYQQQHRENHERIDYFLSQLLEVSARLLVSDVPSFPLFLAKKLSLPAIIISNFTWHGIYRDWPTFADDLLLAEIAREYHFADLALRMPFGIPMPEFHRMLDVPLVCRVGQSKREEISHALKLDPHKKWALCYLGNGAEEFDLKRFDSDSRIDYLWLAGADTKNNQNKRVPLGMFRGEDMMASVDLVIAKPGYGIAADCIAHNVPLLTTVRDDFAEFPALRAGLENWGRVAILSRQAFTRGELATSIDKLLASEIKNPLRTDGAEVCARILAQTYHQGSLDESQWTAEFI